MAEMSPVCRRMIEDMRIRNLSPATQKSYVQAVAKFSHHFKRSPARLGAEQVRVYQLHLVARGISGSERNKVVSALRFFYRVTLGRSDLPEHIPHAKQPRKLPVVLSPQEVVRFLQAVPELNKRVALTTAYSAGLRVSEVTHLKIGDIDSRRMLIHVEAGKSLPSRKRGRQGSLRWSLTATVGDAAPVLSAGAPAPLALSRPHTRPAAVGGRPPCRLPRGQCRS